MVDLCTLEDVKEEGAIEGTSYDSKIAYKITDMSEEIMEVIGDDTLTRNNRNARKACVFGVLDWLEKKKIITTAKNVTSESEGDLSRSYSQESSTSNGLAPTSYKDDFEKYMLRLMPVTKTGILIDMVYTGWDKITRGV